MTLCFLTMHADNLFKLVPWYVCNNLDLLSDNDVFSVRREIIIVFVLTKVILCRCIFDILLAYS